MDLKNVMKIREKIKIYINKADLWHLIEIGAPEDEYNSYIDRVISFIVNKKPDKADLEAELYSVFKTKEFELEKDKIRELVENISSIKLSK